MLSSKVGVLERGEAQGKQQVRVRDQQVGTGSGGLENGNALVQLPCGGCHCRLCVVRLSARTNLVQLAEGRVWLCVATGEQCWMLSKLIGVLLKTAGSTCHSA
jgi:hypothetical protein